MNMTLFKTVGTDVAIKYMDLVFVNYRNIILSPVLIKMESIFL